MRQLYQTDEKGAPPSGDAPSDESGFAYAFTMKEAYGLTPLAYRKRNDSLSD